MVYECRNNHATFSAAYCPTCDAIARAKAAEAAIAELRETMTSQAELIDDQGKVMTVQMAEVERLRERVAALSHTNAVMAGSYGECQQALDAMREQVATLRAALENAEAERDDYRSVLDDIADGVADPEWTAREALGRNDE